MNLLKAKYVYLIVAKAMTFCLPSSSNPGKCISVTTTHCDIMKGSFPEHVYEYTLSGSGFWRLDCKFPDTLEEDKAIEHSREVTHLVWRCCCPQDLITFFAWISINFGILFERTAAITVRFCCCRHFFFFFLPYWAPLCTPLYNLHISETLHGVFKKKKKLAQMSACC